MVDLESEQQLIQQQQSSAVLTAVALEIQLLLDCSGDPHITRFFESFIQGSKLFIVMEYVGGGSVKEAIQRKGGLISSEVFIAIILREVLLGVSFLHRMGKIHRDIKCANILLATNGDVKLADFGVSAQLSETMSKRSSIVGTPCWMAPEIIVDNTYDSKCDVWSIGICGIEMGQGQPPFADLTPMETFLQIHHGDPPTLKGGNWSPEFLQFLSLCLIKDPKRRPSASELLKHKFILGAKKTSYLTELLDFDSSNEVIASQKLAPMVAPSNIALSKTATFTKQEDALGPKGVQLVKQTSLIQNDDESFGEEIEDGFGDDSADLNKNKLNSLIANGWTATGSDMLASSSRRRMNQKKTTGPMPKKVVPQTLGQELDDVPDEEVIKSEDTALPGSSGGSFSGPQIRRKPPTFGQIIPQDLNILLRDEIGTNLGFTPEESKMLLGPAFKLFTQELMDSGTKHGVHDLSQQVILEIAKRFVQQDQQQ